MPQDLKELKVKLVLKERLDLKVLQGHRVRKELKVTLDIQELKVLQGHKVRKELKVM